MAVAFLRSALDQSPRQSLVAQVLERVCYFFSLHFHKQRPMHRLTWTLPTFRRQPSMLTKLTSTLPTFGCRTTPMERILYKPRKLSMTGVLTLFIAVIVALTSLVILMGALRRRIRSSRSSGTRKHMGSAQLVKVKHKQAKLGSGMLGRIMSRSRKIGKAVQARKV